MSDSIASAAATRNAAGRHAGRRAQRLGCAFGRTMGLSSAGICASADAIRHELRRLQPDPPEYALPVGTTIETLEPHPDGELGRPPNIRRQARRAMPEQPLVHHSVFRRTPNLFLDHYSSNRRLLRPIPGDAQPVYDPPFFYSATPRQEARQIVHEAFKHIPVRAADWLTLGGIPVVRSDDWVAVGERRDDLQHARSRDTFVAIGSEWLLHDRCPCANLTLDPHTRDYEGVPVDAMETAEWVVEILKELEPFVPALRAYMSVQPAPKPPTAAHSAQPIM